MKEVIGIALIVIGVVLVADQLWLFGIPIGPFLPDLSSWDITGSPVIHHWMLGVVLVIVGFVIMTRSKRR